jgi:prophage regulatory protein
MAEQPQDALAILRRKQVESRVGLGRSTIYSKVAAGEFPAPVNLGGRAVGWLASEIEAWIAAQVAATRGETTSGARRATR